MQMVHLNLTHLYVLCRLCYREAKKLKIGQQFVAVSHSTRYQSAHSAMPSPALTSSCTPSSGDWNRLWLRYSNNG